VLGAAVWGIEVLAAVVLVADVLRWDVLGCDVFGAGVLTWPAGGIGFGALPLLDIVTAVTSTAAATATTATARAAISQRARRRLVVRSPVSRCVTPWVTVLSVPGWYHPAGIHCC
jgi:hypothetical protein